MALNPFAIYDVVMGLLSGVGIVYLLYVEQFVIEYRQFLFVTTVGLLVFAVVGPIFDLLDPSLVHVVHGVAALLVIFGLYNPVHNDLRKDEWAELLLKDPTEMRHPAEWMAPIDDRIIELFHSSNLVLTPAIIAYNIEYSRGEVNRRLTKLERHGLIERVERGKYRISGLGEQYLQGGDGEHPVERTTAEQA